MQACVKTVTSRTGTGVQTVTGIVDQDGVAFVGKLAFFVSVGATLDTLSYQTGANITAMVWNYGAATETLGASSSFGSIDQFFSKICSTGDTRRYCLGDYQPDVFFGGNWQGYAYVSDFRSGEVDLTYSLNNRGGWGFMMVVLGGDDLTVDMAASLLSGATATTGEPVAVLAMGASYEMDAATAATTAAGGSQVTWGWDTRDFARGVGASNVVNQGGNGRGQLTSRMFTSISGGSFSGAPYVSAWGGSSYTISDGYAVDCNRFAFSGVRAYAGTASLRTTPGAQTIALGIAAKWVKIVAVGIEESASVDTAQFQMSTGWTDGTRQSCAWVGETASTSPITGARYLSTSSIIRIAGAGAVGGSTAFSAVASVTSIDNEAGSITLDVSVADGTPYQLLIFALGDDREIPPPTYHTVSLVERRLRRAPHLTSELRRQFVSMFQVHLQPGIGKTTGLGEEPVVMFRYSRDGGRTWSSERQLPAGAVGEYTRRCMTWQLGEGRDFVFEVAVTDPCIPWALVAAYLEAKVGRN